MSLLIARCVNYPICLTPELWQWLGYVLVKHRIGVYSGNGNERSLNSFFVLDLRRSSQGSLPGQPVLTCRLLFFQCAEASAASFRTVRSLGYEVSDLTPGYCQDRIYFLNDEAAIY